MAVSYNPRIVTDGLVLALDAGNPKPKGANVMPEPTDIYGWYTSIEGSASTFNCTISRDTTTSSPVGNSPLKMDVTSNDPYVDSFNNFKWNLASASQGETWVSSVYAKASTNTDIELYIFGANSSGNGVSNGDFSAEVISVTTEWKRYSFYRTFTSLLTQYVQARLDGPGAGGAGQTVWFDGWEVSRVRPFRDLSGNENNATLINGPTYSSANGGAIVFDGTDDRGTFASPITASSNQTYEVWTNAIASASANGGYAYILHNNSVNGSTGGSYLTIGIKPTQQYFAALNGAYATMDSGVTASNSNTVQIVLTWDGTTQKMYINGDLKDSEALSTTPQNFSTTTSFGDWQNSTTRPIEGNIYAIKIYNKALTASEIQQNFNALRGRFGI